MFTAQHKRSFIVVINVTREVGEVDAIKKLSPSRVSVLFFKLSAGVQPNKIILQQLLALIVIFISTKQN